MQNVKFQGFSYNVDHSMVGTYGKFIIFKFGKFTFPGLSVIGDDDDQASSALGQDCNSCDECGACKQSIYSGVCQWRNTCCQ